MKDSGNTYADFFFQLILTDVSTLVVDSAMGTNLHKWKLRGHGRDNIMKMRI